MSDIVERLRARKAYGTRWDGARWYMLTELDADCVEAAAEIERLGALAAIVREQGFEIERLKREVEEWKERCAAERRDHEATIRHFDELMNDGPDR